MLALLTITAACVPFVAAVLGPTGANSGTTPTASAGNFTIHYVTAGKDKNEFQPNSIVANIGDIVTFQFYPLNHSVIRSAYGWPCIPIEDTPQGGTPFNSGFFPVEADLASPPSWNLTVNTTEPIWYYCGAKGSCIDWGMLGVINPDNETSLATQLELARKAQIMLLPGQEFPSEQAEASFSALAHSITVSTKSVTATPSSTVLHMTTSTTAASTTGSGGGGSGMSTGEIAGTVVGVSAAVLLIAAFFVLIYRTRLLKQKLDRERATVRGVSYAGGPLPPPPLSSGCPTARGSLAPHIGQYSPRFPENFAHPDEYKEPRMLSWSAASSRTGTMSQSPVVSWTPAQCPSQIGKPLLSPELNGSGSFSEPPTYHHAIELDASPRIGELG